MEVMELGNDQTHPESPHMITVSTRNCVLKWAGRRAILNIHVGAYFFRMDATPVQACKGVGSMEFYPGLFEGRPLHGGFQNNTILVVKPMVLGIPHFKKPPPHRPKS